MFLRYVFGISLALVLSGLTISIYTQAVYAFCNKIEGVMTCNSKR